VRHLVELHGGSVSVVSPGVGQGGTFTVELPMKTEEVSLEASAQGGFVSIPDPIISAPQPTISATMPRNHFIQAQPSSTIVLTGIHILIVDDDPDNLDLLRFLLQQDGAIVTAVSEPLEALRRIAEQPPNLIISNIEMPELNGYKLMQNAKSQSIASRSIHSCPSFDFVC
jgi:Response regulator receiver domain